MTENDYKIPRTFSFVTTAALNTKPTDIGNKIPDITKLGSKPVLHTKATKNEDKKLHTVRFTTTPSIDKQRINFDARMKEVTKNFALKVDKILPVT